MTVGYMKKWILVIGFLTYSSLGWSDVVHLVCQIDKFEDWRYTIDTKTESVVENTTYEVDVIRWDDDKISFNRRFGFVWDKNLSKHPLSGGTIDWVSLKLDWVFMRPPTLGEKSRCLKSTTIIGMCDDPLVEKSLYGKCQVQRKQF